jgi:hypothetical protein
MASSYEVVSQHGSSSSLASIAESLARIENKMADLTGPNKSQYGSQPRPTGSFDPASVSGGRGWSSEQNQYSTFTAPRSHESLFGSLPERITESLLGI